MRPIDADALMEVFRGEEGAKALDHFPLRLIRVKQIVDNAPTIDAIPAEWISAYMNKSYGRVRAEIIREMLDAWMEQEAR